MNQLQDVYLSRSENYDRIAQAIVYMQQHHQSQPDLATVARQVHLSEYHFQRLFSQWAGISPKRFLQFLTIEYAKSKLAETRNLLNLAIATGLSSPGRLHDLFVTIEAMSPGEFKAGGAGLKIRYGIQNTPFGTCLIATTARGICHLQFLDTIAAQSPAQDPLQVLQSHWQNAELMPDPEAIAELSHTIFAAPRERDRPLALFVKGTNFQLQVWRALLQIPFAGITTYGTLAALIGQPTAARAVGTAIGKNAIAYLIPCHRVIRESGEIGGYRWGGDRKTALLGWEASQALHSQSVRDSEV